MGIASATNREILEVHSENLASTSAIDIDAEWVRKLEENANYEAQRRVRHQNSTIIKVLKVFRDVEPEAYDPMIVSLGPYHHHEPRLQATNQLKWLLLNKLLEKGHEESLSNYLILVKGEQTNMRNTYSETSIYMCDDQFVEMMLLDCVFVIMILWFWKDDSGLEAIEDPIFRSGQRILILLARDMLLLENQLPFSLLEALFNKAFPDKDGSLKTWISQFFSSFMGNEHTLPNLNNVTIQHILHLLYLCIVSNYISSSTSQPSEDEKAKEGRFPSATRLKETGIKFRRKQSPKNFFDITFEKGVLKIPQFEVDDDTNIIWRNLIALEQSHNNDITIVGDPFTTYVFFLSCIIHSGADVEILLRNDIITNNLGNNEEVAQLFKKLCKEVVINHGKCCIPKAFKDVGEHNSSTWKRWRADLNHTYFRTPWSMISFIAAISLFIITLIQLIFTILNYFHARK